MSIYLHTNEDTDRLKDIDRYLLEIEHALLGSSLMLSNDYSLYLKAAVRMIRSAKSMLTHTVTQEELNKLEEPENNG